MAILGVRQQQAGEEGAQGHGNPDQFHQPCCANHHQQRRGGGDLWQRGFGHHAKHRSQQIAPADHHDGDAGQHLQAVVQVFADGGAVIATGQQRHHGDQGDRGDVLKQQDRERQPPVGAGQFLAFSQALQAERRGRQRQTQAQDDRGVQWLAKQPQRHHADHRTRQQHLGQAHAEH
ncbi:hypothetical protein D3C72_1168880 [compost metagenome]